MCDTLFNIVSVIFTSLVAIAWISVLYGSFIVLFKNNNKNISGSARVLRLIFLISTFIAIGYYPIFRWRPCIESKLSFNIYSLTPIWEIFYALQLLTVSTLFFVTIQNVFKGTSLTMSKCTKSIFKTIFIIGGISVIPATMSPLIFPSDSATFIWAALFAVLILLYIGTMISLNILFIRKLIIVYKNTAQSFVDKSQNSHKHKSLVTPITKLTVLLSISVITTIMDLITTILYVFIRIETVRYIAECVTILDLYTNFINVLLTYNMFNKHYHRICGCIDKRFRRCWLQIIMGEQMKDEIQLATMMSKTKSVDTINMSTPTETHTSQSPDIEIVTD